MTSAMFTLLVALSAGPQHGYGLIDRVDELTEGRMRLGAGTLYRTLQRMQTEDLVIERDAPDGVDTRRRTYTLTAKGAAAMLAELDRLERSVRAARHWIEEHAS
jgi:DNA-binding PadR family transcriptional regulator